MPSPQPVKVLCIGHNTEALESLHRDLADHFDIHTADSDQQALDMIREQGPYGAVLTDLPENAALLEEIRNLSPASPRILLAQKNEIAIAQHAAESGQISRYLLEPCTRDELLSTIDEAVVENIRTLHKLQLEQEAAELLSAGDRLRSAMMYDPELGIGSQDAMEIELEYTHNIAVRYKRPYSIAVFDLDCYSQYVLHYGRKAARLAHKLMAEHIRHSCRAADRIYRCSAGTPVLLILPETNTSGARVLAERIITTFFARNIPNIESEHDLLTLSASLSGYDPDDIDRSDNWQALYDDANVYLQVAQGQGGNCVTCSNKEPETVD